MNDVTSAKIVDSQADPDPLANALWKLQSDNSKNCHFLPSERRALAEDYKMLQLHANQAEQWKDAYYKLKAQIENGEIVFDEMDGER